MLSGIFWGFSNWGMPSRHHVSMLSHGHTWRLEGAPPMTWESSILVWTMLKVSRVFRVPCEVNSLGSGCGAWDSVVDGTSAVERLSEWNLYIMPSWRLWIPVMVACWLVVFGAPNFHFLEFLVANWCLNAFEALHAVSQLRCIACSSTHPGSVVLSAMFQWELKIFTEIR